MARAVPGRRTASLFSSSTCRPRLAAMPMLLAAAKPPFSGLRISRTAGKWRRTIGALPSVEALSTTIVSQARSPTVVGDRRQAVGEQLAGVVADDDDR